MSIAFLVQSALQRDTPNSGRNCDPQPFRVEREIQLSDFRGDEFSFPHPSALQLRALQGALLRKEALCVGTFEIAPGISMHFLLRT